MERLRNFYAPSRVLAHLHHSLSCKQTLQTRRVTCSPLPGFGSRSDRHLADLNGGALPMLQAQGPLLPQVPNAWDTYDLPFLEVFYLHLWDGVAPGP